MAVDPKYIQSLLETALPGAQVAIRDMVGDGDHLEATIVASQFEGISMLKQHQAVYAALGDMMKEKLHALALKTYSPTQWAKTKGAL